MFRKIRRIVHLGLRREEGQAGFEFMLVLPVFFLFFLLLIDFGVLMYTYVSAANGVREGARYGSVNCGDGSCAVIDIKQRVVDRSGGALSDVNDVTVTWPGGFTRGSSVVVKVSHTYNAVFFPFSHVVTSCADMRLEQTDSGNPPTGGSSC